MRNNYRIEPMSTDISSTFNQSRIQPNYIRTIDDNYNISIGASLSCEKYNSIKNYFQKIFKRCHCPHVEKRGVERISPEDRTDLTIMNTAMIWVGASIIVPTFVTGILGPAVFKLDLYTSFATIIIFNLLGFIPIGIMACFGPASGLRTMIFSRYSWGYYGASIMSIINVIAALGWAAINSITGAQTLRVVFDDSLPLSVGIIIISFVSMIISFVGYKWIHIYERYSWIPIFIAYCILGGVGAKYFTHSQTVSSAETKSDNENHYQKIIRIINFGMICLGGSVSWCTYAADYNTYFPEDTSQLKIFLLTYIGNIMPVIPLQLLGAAAYTGTYTNSKWADAYEINNVGGLLGASLSPLRGFRKFLLILFALSTVASNIPNVYSYSLSIQVVAPIFERVPRFLYTVIGTVIYVLMAIFAANNFNESLTSFISLSLYFYGIFTVIVFEDHLIFRRCSFKNYNFNIWDSRKKLPIGLAAILSSFVGIVGIVLGMSQTWFSGPIAKAIANGSGEQGADVGFIFGLIFAGVAFPLFRFVELYFIGR
ncbi:unnamed protein product [Adineta steineri]|uniref:Purine-cytosine permease n=1 Tax=Adineta steineri TaxID=433720 RepID=A0A819H1I6_9BILA|nr:unnamed protein product [Adineta steineri]